MKKWLIFGILFVISINFIFAGRYDNCEIYGNCEPESKSKNITNYITSIEGYTKGNPDYLYNDSNTMYFNETRSNITIRNIAEEFNETDLINSVNASNNATTWWAGFDGVTDWFNNILNKLNINSQKLNETISVISNLSSSQLGNSTYLKTDGTNVMNGQLNVTNNKIILNCSLDDNLAYVGFKNSTGQENQGMKQVCSNNIYVVGGRYGINGLQLFGGNETNASSISILPSRYIGMGINSPKYPLHINGTAFASEDVCADGICLFDKSSVLLDMPFSPESILNSTYVLDNSLYNNNGIAINLTYNRSGGHIFDGKTSYINISTIGFPTGNKNFSISLWLNPENTTAQKIMFFYGTNAVSQSYYIEFGSATCGANKIGTGKWGGMINCYGTALTLNTWHFVTAVYNGTSSTLYVEGSQVDSDVTALNLVNTYANIGRYNSGSYFNGSIDDVMFFNRSLSAEEISALYNKQKNDKEFYGNIYPDTNNTRSIGSNLLRWSKGWFVNLDVSNHISTTTLNATTDVCITGGNCLSSSSQTWNYTKPDYLYNDTYTIYVNETKLNDTFIKRDGTTPLTANWDVGNFNVINISKLNTSSDIRITNGKLILNYSIATNEAYIGMVNTTSQTNQVIKWALNNILVFGGRYGQAGLQLFGGNETSSPALAISPKNYIKIGGTGAQYPLHIQGNETSSGISLFVDGMISINGSITRTSTYSEKDGKPANDWVQDSKYYLTDGIIDHSKFYGYTNWKVPTYNRTIENGIEKVEVIGESTVEGINVEDEINVLRQALYDTQCELCSYDNKYTWCGKCK